VRAYHASDEESLLARSLLKDWAGEGFLSESQHKQMEQESVSELRRTNIFLRLVLFFFALIIVGAAVGLFFLLFLERSSQQTIGLFLLAFAAVSYVAAELATSKARLYRYGIEEALLVCCVGFVCVGMYFTLSSGSFLFTSERNAAEFLAAVAGSILSLWIWHRFGLPYFFLGAMIFAVWLPSYWTSSDATRHVAVAALYAAALLTVMIVRPRHRFTFLIQQYSIAEALLWFGIYLAINLQLSDSKLSGRATTEFARPFYWTTWTLIWCLPPLVLARGLRLKDRFVIVAGAIVAILTLITNKSYLGGERHTWDPMLLGAFLIVVALVIRRWLASGLNEIRHGFTARRLSGKDKVWLNTAATALGLAAPNAIASSPQAASPDAQFGGGDSGGGGASSEW